MQITYLIKIQSMNEYIGAVLLSHSLPGQLQVCGPAKPGNHCLKFPNFGFLKFHVHYQLWFLYVFVFVSKIDICHMYRSQTLLWHVWGRYWFENRSLDFGFGSQHSLEKTSRWDDSLFSLFENVLVSKGCKEHLTSRCPQKWEQTISFHSSETEAVACNSDAGANQNDQGTNNRREIQNRIQANMIPFKQTLASGQKSGIFVSAQWCATWVSGKAVSVMRAKTASFQFLFAGVWGAAWLCFCDE